MNSYRRNHFIADLQDQFTVVKKKSEGGGGGGNWKASLVKSLEEL